MVDQAQTEKTKRLPKPLAAIIALPLGLGVVLVALVALLAVPIAFSYGITRLVGMPFDFSDMRLIMGAWGYGLGSIIFLSAIWDITYRALTGQGEPDY
jgi:vacuolar-type H+-ATPase subunit I/STV1